MGRWVWSALVWLVLAGYYLFLAGTISTVEIVAMGVCAGLGAALAFGLITVAHRHHRFQIPLRAVINPLLSLFPETASVGRRLVAVALSSAQDQVGGYVRQPFEPGDADEAVAAGRRATAVLGLSLAPGSFVIRGERSDILILHALPERPASPDRLWPA